jgi:segregation and condensation protein B
VSEQDLERDLEAILFSAGEPLTPKRLAAVTGAPETAVKTALEALGKRLTGGIRLAHATGAYRLVTAPEAAETVRAFLEDTSRSDLTRAALETLAIIAYRGPITRAGIEHVRGVASEAMIRNLMARGLISETSRSNEAGRPWQYEVSHTFLQHFGLASTADLPPLPEGAA